MNANDYNQLQIDRERITGEHVTKLTKFWQDAHLLKSDGKCGPATLESILGGEVLDADTEPTRQIWEAFDGPLDYLPRSRKDVYRIFGNPSDGGKADRKWVKENIRTYRDLPGVPHKWYVKLNKLVEPYVREALRRASEVSDYEITRFGSFVYRHQQHNPNKPLSYHSWGIAFDINPHQNKGKHYSRGAAPKPFSDEWDDTWPDGMDKEFVDAIKSVGFGWGGDWSTFKDNMHFEALIR